MRWDLQGTQGRTYQVRMLEVECQGAAHINRTQGPSSLGFKNLVVKQCRRITRSSFAGNPGFGW